MLSWSSFKVLRTIFFPSHWLLSHLTIVETTDSGDRGMNPVTKTIINPWKEHRPSRGSNRWPPALKSETLPTELWGLAELYWGTELIIKFVPGNVGSSVITDHCFLNSGNKPQESMDRSTCCHDVTWIMLETAINTIHSIDIITPFHGQVLYLKPCLFSKKMYSALCHTIQTFNEPPRKKHFENIVGKGENAGNQHFLLFPQWFLHCLRKEILSFWSHLFFRQML